MTTKAAPAPTTVMAPISQSDPQAMAQRFFHQGAAEQLRHQNKTYKNVPPIRLAARASSQAKVRE
ncbi:hypothetical protein A6A04_21365 [Paramagnetospirillum marisnigri]|uniref:Uncharacterized protein n=1 Tax=Paramagnetospirillum marisnigri TaxID=1285242 RepID=A0A178MY71_9PROT|nr:hypothetical protein A6A04_21365 [Paramagnetospirillum marisnigri]